MGKVLDLSSPQRRDISCFSPNASGSARSCSQLIDQIGRDRSALLPILQEVQRKYFHISEYCMQVIADLLDIHPVEVHSVVSFYSFLDERPKASSSSASAGP